PFDPPVLTLCGKPVVVVDAGESYCAPPDRLVVSALTLAHGPAALDQAALDRVSEVLVAADLAQVVQLGVQVIVVAASAPELAIGPRTAVVTPDRLAERLLAAAARTAGRLFVHPEGSRPQREPEDPERRWPSPVTGRPVSGEEAAVEGYALCLRYHLLAHLGERERLAELEPQVARLGEMVHDLAAWLARIP